MKFHRAAAQRGTSRDGARTSTFSSGDYVDVDWMGFGALRQLNEDRLAPGATVAPQRVANMELLTLVLDGTLHREGVALPPGALAWTGAGFAAQTPAETAGDTGARVLRLALQPARVNLPPTAGVHLPSAGSGDDWQLRVAPDGESGALPVRQQAWLRQARLGPDATCGLALDAARRHWLQLLHGDVVVGDRRLGAGDALGWRGEAVSAAIVAGDAGADLLLLTLPD